MKKTVSLLLMLILALALCPGNAAEDTGILGRPFPDFSVTDTGGDPFTLSGALKDHEAVLINIWATWCYPCELEFPILNHLYEKYSERAAFIALSSEPKDTSELIEAYRQGHGIAFPMGRDEDRRLQQLIGAAGIPVTVIVDRFGNTAFIRVGAFLSEKDAERTLNAFLGDGYTETVPMTEIPPDTSTAAYPVSVSRSISPVSKTAGKFLVYVEGEPDPLEVYTVPDETARLRIEVRAEDDPAGMVFSYSQNLTGDVRSVPDLYDPEAGAFIFEGPMPVPSDESHMAECLLVDLQEGTGDENAYEIVLIPDESYIDEVVAVLEGYGYEVVRWVTAGPVREEGPLQAYVLHVRDQNGQPVPNVYVNFCTDTTCTLAMGDEDGTITFEGSPDIYHIQLLRLPDGYSADPGFELYTSDAYGEWVLRLKKD